MTSFGLRQPDSRFEALAESAPDAILTIDQESRILSANPATERIFGYAPDELIGQPMRVLIPERLREAHDAGVARYVSSGKRTIPWTGVQLPGLTKDGREIPVEISFGEFLDDRGRRVFSGFIRDITERVVQQEALAERENELRRLNTELRERAREEHALRTIAQAITGAVRVEDIMQQIAEGALGVAEASGAFVEQIINPNGEVEIVARSGTHAPPGGLRVRYPGSLTEEIIEQREPIIVASLDRLGPGMAPYLEEHCPGCSVLVVPLMAETQPLGALVLLREPGEPAFEHGIVNRVRTLGDLASLSLQRVLALADSERRRDEAEAAVRSRDEVLSIVSHDLRNPVSTVAMAAALLKDTSIELTTEQRLKQLDIISRSAHRMNRLIRDLLDVARIEGGRFAVHCKCETPGTLVTETCEEFRSLVAEKDIRLECRVEPNLPRVNVDRDRVVQAIANFLNNAIKFTPAGGRIIVGATPADGEGGVRFFVTDSGAGIASEELPNLFNRFWQAKRTAHLGAGLGLTIARGIASAHGGRVWAESRRGAGSTFNLSVPHSRKCT